MKTRSPRFGGRSIGLLILAILVAGIMGSVVSHFLAGAFPEGPVRDFFFKSLDIGIPTFVVNLGFVTLTFGLSFAISTFAVLLLALAVYFWYKF